MRFAAPTRFMAVVALAMCLAPSITLSAAQSLQDGSHLEARDPAPAPNPDEPTLDARDPSDLLDDPGAEGLTARDEDLLAAYNLISRASGLIEELDLHTRIFDALDGLDLDSRSEHDEHSGARSFRNTRRKLHWLNRHTMPDEQDPEKLTVQRPFRGAGRRQRLKKWKAHQHKHGHKKDKKAKKHRHEDHDLEGRCNRGSRSRLDKREHNEALFKSLKKAIAARRKRAAEAQRKKALEIKERELEEAHAFLVERGWGEGIGEDDDEVLEREFGDEEVFDGVSRSEIEDILIVARVLDDEEDVDARLFEDAFSPSEVAST